MASSGDSHRPPSEKESGVTLTIPITAGRGPSSTDTHARIVAKRSGSAPRTGRPCRDDLPELTVFPGTKPSRRRSGWGLVAAGLADERHGLGPGRLVVLEQAPYRRRHGERARLLHA